MRIVSVNAGMPREVSWNGAQVQTAIFKEPVEGSVPIGKLNLAGDKQADLNVHGGPEKAVYAYPAEHYEYWRAELPDVQFSWGRFGENLTTEGLHEEALFIGDCLRVGSAVLMITQPRTPCYKLSIRLDRTDMPKLFLRSGRSGFYLAVVEEGEVSAGSKIEFVSRDPQSVSVADIMRLYLAPAPDLGLLRRALQISALPMKWKTALESRAADRGQAAATSSE